MNPNQPDRMLMVYNAEEGFFNALNDWAHKFFSPETYECPLCRFTYGMTSMLMPWKKFIEQQAFPVSFQYRPEFRKSYPQFKALPLPLILIEQAGTVEPLIFAEEIEATGGLTALIGLVQSRLEGRPPPSRPV